MAEIPHTGMAVSSDRGDSLDVHPKQKREVGERLAAWALNKTYGYKNVIPSGPLYKSVVFSGGAAYISFDYAEGLSTSDGKPLRTFEVLFQMALIYSLALSVSGPLEILLNHIFFPVECIVNTWNYDKCKNRSVYESSDDRYRHRFYHI